MVVGGETDKGKIRDRTEKFSCDMNVRGGGAVRAPAMHRHATALPCNAGPAAPCPGHALGMHQGLSRH